MEETRRCKRYIYDMPQEQRREVLERFFDKSHRIDNHVVQPGHIRVSKEIKITGTDQPFLETVWHGDFDVNWTLTL